MNPELSVPNLITLARVLLTPLFLWCVTSGSDVLVQWSGAIFLLAAISDWYDGWYARRYNASTPLGRFMDPLADKVLVGTALIAFAINDILPIWMVAVVVGRDLLLTVIRVGADRLSRPIRTSRLAQWKTALQLVFLFYLVAAWTFRHIAWLDTSSLHDTVRVLLDPTSMGIAMLLLTLLTVATAVQYMRDNRQTIRTLLHASFARTAP